MKEERSDSAEITTTLLNNAAKNILRIYMKETSVFRNDEIPAFILGKPISQVIIDSSMRVARHKKTKHSGWYAQGVEYISFGKTDQESKDRFLFVDDHEAVVIEFASGRQAGKALEFK